MTIEPITSNDLQESVRNPKGITILIVEDEDLLRNAMVLDFQRKGYTVLATSNGKLAFELIKKHDIDVVLSDIRMPHGDGIELLGNIKTLNPNIPVLIFITGYADITVEDAYDKGADAIFSKPFDRNELFGAVSRALTTNKTRWKARKFERINCDLKIDLQLSELKKATTDRVLNLGRGGMSICFENSVPIVGERLDFNIVFENGTPENIEGTGIVRWVGSFTPGKGTSCGIEFEYLSDKNRNQVIELIEHLKLKAFIPRR